MILYIYLHTGYPRGFAHVTFTNKRISTQAINELNGIEMMGRPLKANYATVATNAGVGASVGAGNNKGNNSNSSDK